jgi:hypothetical protein
VPAAVSAGRIRAEKKEVAMCLDCGCGKPNDDHGDARHITMNQISDAAKASGISPQEAVQNIERGFQQAQAEMQTSAREGSTQAMGAHD